MSALFPLPDQDQLQLLPEELERLTGTPQAALQIEWLKLNGWAHSLTRAGKPVVGRLYANLRRDGIELTKLIDGFRPLAQPSNRAWIAPARKQFSETGLGRWQAEQREIAAEQAAEQTETERQNAPWLAENAARLRAAQAERTIVLRRSQNTKRRAAHLKRTPPWADFEAIKAVYAEAQRLTKKTGVKHHVDHIIPLQGRLVSGLHVQGNLRAVPWIDNIRKHNRFDPS